MEKIAVKLLFLVLWKTKISKTEKNRVGLNYPFMFTNEKPIKQVINELLNAYKLNGKIDELKIWNNWPEIVGTVIAKNTSKMQLKGGILTLYVESAPLKNELMFHRSVILQKINSFFEKQIVKEIHIK